MGGSPRIKIKEDDETTIIQLDSAYDNDKGKEALQFPTIDLSTIDVSHFESASWSRCQRCAHAEVVLRGETHPTSP